jgi:hypothetical protein
MSADHDYEYNQTDEVLDEILPDHARDLLISRVIDGRASTSDWDRFRALAANEPGVWTELAHTQEQHEMVRDEVNALVRLADRVELPGGIIDEEGTRRRLSFVSKWGGWAIAAALLVVWSLGMPNVSTPGGTQIAGIPGIGLNEAEPEQAFERYLESGQKSGQVIAEMPEQVVVETKPLPDGTIEVIYLRQVIERRVIDHAYRMLQDETGNAVPVPVKVERNTFTAF